MSNQQQPYILPHIQLPEITVKGIVLGAVLSAILSAANAYLGLFAGMTVSASIPASVISMAVLRMFRQSNILENNGVQTAASSGESLAAGVIFTFPALVLMQYWTQFNYWETTLISLCGGLLGVFFTIPLRRALIVKQQLQFPEGVATAEVLKTGTAGGKSLRFLVFGSISGALLKLCEAGFHLWGGVFEKAALLQQKAYVYFGINLSPALVAVGYIVRIRIAVLVFLGGVISWWLAIPAYIAKNGSPEGVTALELGNNIWSAEIRYLGAGAMLIGGVWALLGIRKSLSSALTEGIAAFRQPNNKETLRTERDIPMPIILLTIAGLLVPIFIIYYYEIGQLPVSLFMAVVMALAGFLFSAVAGYMAGLVGSSNNPISGVTIATLLVASVLLLLFLGSGSAKGPAAAVLIGAVVCCAAAMSGDNMQDLKSGYILGATPVKQQIMQIVGVAAAAFVLAPVLTLLHTAYGFGPQTAQHPHALAAPQATLMQSVAEGVFGGTLPWAMIVGGIVLGAVIIFADAVQERRGSSFRLPVLAVAVGAYLPFELDSAIMLGGLISWLAERQPQQQNHTTGRVQEGNQAGLLFASGLITGEALVGIALAVPVALSGSTNVLALLQNPLGSWVGAVALAAVCAGLYVAAVKKEDTV
ncbi:oligopeptide transporter, OPT family [Sphingobacteriales bacterium UPWRP_1]|nr:oligopeptide transporter, OPT family [Sphingobacteriales bacterium TSM_CSS]PSJ74975.1 oligopeptide transporter, OPT family [Sphingobacteriales bacterium UPWRP_1]